MSELFDDISRVIGSQLPRRRLLRLLAGVLAGGALGALRTSHAQTIYPCGQEFPLTGRAVLDNIDCSHLPPLDYQNQVTNCYPEARNDGLADAKAHCPPTCPSPVERSWTNGGAGCSVTNPADLTCWGTGRYVCRGSIVSPAR
jgi:hypothetical protein